MKFMAIVLFLAVTDCAMNIPSEPYTITETSRRCTDNECWIRTAVMKE